MKVLTTVGLTLLAVFIVLKLTNLIAWEWVWVLSPLWILGIIWGLIFLAVLAVFIFAFIASR